MLNNAVTMAELRVPPNNRLEKLVMATLFDHFVAI